MAICSSCRYDNPPGTERCLSCGASIASVIAPFSARTMDSDLEERLRRLLNEGRKIEAIRVYRETTGVGLAEAEDAVDAIETQRGLPSLARALEKQLISLLEQRKKIEAIKLYRERTGVSLKEAKDEVDLLARQHNIPAAGCAGMVAVMLVGGTIVGWALLVSAL